MLSSQSFHPWKPHGVSPDGSDVHGMAIHGGGDVSNLFLVQIFW